MFLISLRHPGSDPGLTFSGSGSDFTLPEPGLIASEGAGELEWGGDTGGDTQGAGLLPPPPPRALKAEARPEVSGDTEEVGGDTREYGENRFCLSRSEIRLAVGLLMALSRGLLAAMASWACSSMGFMGACPEAEELASSWPRYCWYRPELNRFVYGLAGGDWGGPTDRAGLSCPVPRPLTRPSAWPGEMGDFLSGLADLQ